MDFLSELYNWEQFKAIIDAIKGIEARLTRLERLVLGEGKEEAPCEDTKQSD